MAPIFISYRREDSAGYAGRLHEELEERLGPHRVFRDVDTLQPGQDFVVAIEERLRECRVFIALIGPGWLTSHDSPGQRRIEGQGDYVRMEIAAALGRPDALVVPVLVGGAEVPSASALPESIRALGRRQAITLRDDVWEEDVNRLASVVARQLAGLPGLEKAPRSWGAAIIALAAIAVVVALLLTWWMGRSGPHGPEQTSSRQEVTDVGGAADAGVAHAIEIPRMSEIAHGDLIYTLLTGSVRPGAGRSTLWLRFRVSNEGSAPANLWDESFRVAAGGEVIPAIGGLNQILDGHSIRQEVVRFDMPSGSPRVVLRITYGGKTGELPLDLTSTGARPTHDEPDAGDALSRADLRSLVREPVALVESGDLRAMLTHANVRRFANMVRIDVDVRLENGGSRPRFSGDLVLRLAADGELRAPVSVTSAAVEARLTLSVDAVFELPTGAAKASLKGSIGAATGEVPFMLR